MEEIKNNQNEESFEQRPSTKYGRTAYQEQLRREQQENGTLSAKQEQFAEQSAYEQLYTKQQSYASYQEQKVEVKNLYAYILMGLVAASAIVNYVVSMMTMEAFGQAQSIDINVVLDILVASTEFTILSYVGDMIFWVSVVFFVLDIMAIQKSGKKIFGAILFAIFLRPAYFIWRAHLLEEKKVIPISYAVVTYIISIAQYAVIFYASMDMVMRTMY